MQTIRRTRARRYPAIALRPAALGLCALALACAAFATQALAGTDPAGTTAPPTVVKKKKPPRPKFENRSGETTAERDRRLLRECRGRPNAGACLGYAS